MGTQFGTYAEFLCIRSERALEAPRAFTTQQNAAFAVNYVAAWIGLMEMARLRASDRQWRDLVRFTEEHGITPVVGHALRPRGPMQLH